MGYAHLSVYKNHMFTSVYKKSLTVAALVLLSTYSHLTGRL